MKSLRFENTNSLPKRDDEETEATNIKKLMLRLEEQSINDICLLKYFPEGVSKSPIPYIILLYGCNNIQKIRSIPKHQKLINYSRETQEIFQLSNIASIGQKFEGKSFMNLVLMGPSKQSTKLPSSYNDIERLMDFRIAMKGDVLKLKVLDKYLSADDVCRAGYILSNGEFVMSEFIPREIVKIYQEKTQGFSRVDETESPTPVNIRFKNQLSYFKDDEIFSSFEFLPNNRILLGTQKGTILLGKVIKGVGENSLKIINSYNRYNNFMITNISLMPDHQLYSARAEHTNQGSETENPNQYLFAYSTADGYIKIQNTLDSYPIYSYQSISVKSIPLTFRKPFDA